MAILLVVFHHSLTSSTMQALDSLGLPRLAEFVSFITRSGVELFFVLSGVVLLRPYLRRERAFNAPSYIRRRVQRLWPPYVVTLLVAGAIIAIPLLHETWYSKEVIPRFSGLDWARQVAIVNFGWPSYSGAWWSLGLEVVFYCLVPIVVVACTTPRFQVAPYATLAVAAIVASVCVAIWASPEVRAGVPAAGGDPNAAAATLSLSRIGFLFLLYLPCFIMGILLAAFSWSSRVGWALVAGGATYCVVALFVPGANIHLGFALLYGGVVLLATSPDARHLRSRLAAPWAIWLGERSYSLFLIHFPVFYLVNYLASLLLPDRNVVYLLLTRTVALPLALLASMTLFWLVERRFARGLSTATDFWPPLSLSRQRPATLGSTA